MVVRRHPLIRCPGRLLNFLDFLFFFVFEIFETFGVLFIFCFSLFFSVDICALLSFQYSQIITSRFVSVVLPPQPLTPGSW